MEITKQRKILIAVAGLACAVFVADRILMGGAMSGPQSASAASGAVTAPAQTTRALTDTAPSVPATDFLEIAVAPSASVPSLAQRLDQARGVLPDQTRDVFRTPAQWQASPDLPTTSPGPSQAFDAQAFARQNPLDAVFSANGQAHAVVAGQIVRIGESRGGLTLTDVGDRWVVWSGYGQKFKLHLDPRQ